MKANEVKVGAITLVAIALLVVMITFLGVFTFSGKQYQIVIEYPSVGGLMKGNVVRYGGVQVGTVKDLFVTDAGRIQVVASIDDYVKIPKASYFSLGSDGILGEKFVDIQPPSGEVGEAMAVNEMAQGNTGGGIDVFMSQSAKVLEKMESLTDAFNNVFGDAEVQKAMRDGFINAKAISDNLNVFTRVMAEVAVDNQQQINHLSSDLSQMAARLNGVATNMEKIIAATNEGHAGENFAKIIENLAKTSARIEQITGVLEKVAEDPQTEQDLKATLHNAREASDKANRMLGVLDTARVQADITHSAKGSDWRSNLGVTFVPKKDTFLYVGGYDVGEENKLDLQLGKRFDDASFSVGSMQGEFGVGFGYDLGKHFTVYSQVYDFDDTKVKVGAELKLSPNFSLLGEQTDVRNGNRNNTYIGIRNYF